MKPSVTLSLIEVRQTNRDVDLSATTKIISRCSKWLLDRGLPDWTNYYTQGRILQKLDSQTGFIFIHKETPVGIVFLSDDLYYYSPLDISKFSSPSSPAIYIGTLAVDPDYHRQGIASYIITYCGNYAKNKNIGYLRLDCNGQDKKLVKYYNNQNFLMVSPMEKEPEYLLFEKTI